MLGKFPHNFRIAILAVCGLLAARGWAQVVPGAGSSSGPTSVILGQVQTATGGSISYGALTFTLSQPAIVSGTATLATEQTACYTSAQGNVVGVPDALATPVLSVSLSSGSLPAGTYYVVVYYIGAGGEGAVSPEASINLSNAGTLFVNAPGVQPNSASGYGVAISTSSGAETIQATVTGWTQYAQNTSLTSGPNPQAQNTSFCSIYLSDQLVPTGTYYTVNLVNKNGSQMAGFPQSWCMYGGAAATINISSGAPTGNCSTNGVFYPTPIFTNPANTLVQSIQSGLNIAGTFNVSGNSTFSGNVNFLGGTGFFTSITSAAANPSTSGFLRLAQIDQILWRNAANSANEGFSTDASDRLNISHAGGVVLTGASPYLRFGGTSNLFPGLFQNSTELDVELADLSAFAPLGLGAARFVEQATAPVGVAASDWLYGLTSDHMLHQNVNNSGQQQVPITGLLSTTYTNATTSFTAVPLSSAFNAAASASYTLTCQITWQASAGTAGPQFEVVVPTGSTVSLNMSSAVTATTGTWKSKIGTGAQSVANTGSVTTSTDFPAIVTVGVTTSTTPGTVVLEAAANGTGTLTIETNSFCVYQ